MEQDVLDVAESLVHAETCDSVIHRKSRSPTSMIAVSRNTHYSAVKSKT